LYSFCIEDARGGTWLQAYPPLEKYWELLAAGPSIADYKLGRILKPFSLLAEIDKFKVSDFWEKWGARGERK